MIGGVLALALLLASPTLAGELVLTPPIEPVVLDSVFDGDTLFVWRTRTGIRLAGIDTPEIRGKCAEEKLAALQARDRLRALLDAARKVEISDCQRDTEMYGRQLCRIAADGQDVGDQLVAEGLARVWTGKREEWCP